MRGGTGLGNGDATRPLGVTSDPLEQRLELRDLFLGCHGSSRTFTTSLGSVESRQCVTPRDTFSEPLTDAVGGLRAQDRETYSAVGAFELDERRVARHGPLQGALEHARQQQVTVAFE